jgi:uncharacterized protein DUF2569
VIHYSSSALPGGPAGRGGWLLFVAAGLAYTVVTLPFGLFEDWLPWLLDQTTWSVLADPTTYGYHPSFPAFVLFYLLATVLIIFAAAVGLVLFGRRSHEFPKYMIAYYLGSFVLFVTVLTVELEMWPYDGDPSSHSETGARMVIAFLWMALGGPYIVRSRRVRNTFSKPAPPAATPGVGLVEARPNEGD